MSGKFNHFPTTPGLSRRQLLNTTMLTGFGALLAGCGSAAAEPISGPALSPSPSPGPGPKSFPAPYLELFPAYAGLNQEAFMSVGSASLCSEVGEVLWMVQKAHAEGGEVDAYFRGYRDLAVKLAGLAATSRRVSARARWLRAAKYYSHALFAVLGSATPAAEESIWQAMNACWSKAAALSSPAWERLSIPFEGSDLPGWFFPAPGVSGRRPVVIISNGSDAQNSDLYAYGIQAALERGYHVLAYDGPGQGETFFVRGIPFRPDWETVIGALVDYLQTRSDVNTDKIALTGWSMAGLLVARAAAFEKRLAAVVSDSGLVNVWLAFPQELRDIAEAGDAKTVNGIWNTEVVPSLSPFEAYTLAKRSSIFSAQARAEARAGKVPSDYYSLARTVQSLTLSPELMARIDTPYLVTFYEDDVFYGDQARTLYEGISGPKTYFTFGEGYRFHCSPLAPNYRNEVVFDWLEEILGS